MSTENLLTVNDLVANQSAREYLKRVDILSRSVGSTTPRTDISGSNGEPQEDLACQK